MMEVDKPDIILYNIFIRYGGIAQLVRVHASHAWGRWFDPSCLHHPKAPV